jgi:hypothetical protein
MKNAEDVLSFSSKTAASPGSPSLAASPTSADDVSILRSRGSLCKSETNPFGRSDGVEDGKKKISLKENEGFCKVWMLKNTRSKYMEGYSLFIMPTIFRIAS